MKSDPNQKTSHEWDKYERVIVFDGVCNFCNWFVNFVMDRDSSHRFKFGTLQSDTAQLLLTELQLPTEDFETFILLDHGQVFTKSTAALRILKQLDNFWPLLFIFWIIPRPIRDVVYNWIARNRYQWMGKTQTCRVPTPADHKRFV